MRTQKEKLEENGVMDDDIIIIDDDEAFCDALVGVSDDMRAVYDEELMVKGICKGPQPVLRGIA